MHIFVCMHVSQALANIKRESRIRHAKSPAQTINPLHVLHCVFEVWRINLLKLSTIVAKPKKLKKY